MSTSLDKRRQALEKIAPAPGLKERMARLAERSDAEAHLAALDDLDAQPSTAEQLRQARAARRTRLNASQARG